MCYYSFYIFFSKLFLQDETHVDFTVDFNTVNVKAIWPPQDHWNFAWKEDMVNASIVRMQ